MVIVTNYRAHLVKLRLLPLMIQLETLDVVFLSTSHMSTYITVRFYKLTSLSLLSFIPLEYSNVLRVKEGCRSALYVGI